MKIYILDVYEHDSFVGSRYFIEWKSLIDFADHLDECLDWNYAVLETEKARQGMLYPEGDNYVEGEHQF